MAAIRKTSKASPLRKTKVKPAARRKPAAKKPAARTQRRWSQSVTQSSDAMTLEPDVFTLEDPKKIAASLKRSAERSHRRKSAPFRSAMSMLTFYVNRAGSKLSAKRKRTLQQAKDELRKAFGKEPSRAAR